MISYALIANGQHNPYLATPLPEHMLYPISQNCKNGIDLDYSALMLGERFVIDEAVYDDIMSSRKEFFGPMKHSFRELSASGLLQKVDYSAFFYSNSSKIKAITNSLLESVDSWLRLEQIQWSTLQKELKEFQRMYGSSEMAFENTSNIGIESWLRRSDQTFNQGLRKKLYLLFEGKNTIESVGEENVRGALQFIVAQIVMSDLVSHSVGAPILDWDDAKGMYKQLYTLRWQDYKDDVMLATETRRLFNVVSPDLKPDNIDEVIKFVQNNKAVSSLRRTLLELISNGEIVNAEWMSKFTKEIISADLVLQKKSSVFQFFGALAGAFSGIWYQSLAVTGITTVTDKLLFRRGKKYDWYYALQGK